MYRESGGNRIGRALMDFFFPRHCPFCGALVGKEAFCADCRKTLPFYNALKQGGFGSVTAPLIYQDKVRKAILDYKFNGKLSGLPAFGTLMAQCAVAHYSGVFNAVTWAPVSKKRLKKRGYDQSYELAASLCKRWHIVPQETLRKVRDNPPQSGLPDAKERHNNVRGVYAAVKPEKIKGRHFLLIDDICTTGATLTECVRVLREAGAADVVCLTLAVTPENETDRNGTE